MHPLHIRLNAATTLTLGGERYLHGWVGCDFAARSQAQLRLVARARRVQPKKPRLVACSAHS